jgi:hypothetical protein
MTVSKRIKKPTTKKELVEEQVVTPENKPDTSNLALEGTIVKEDAANEINIYIITYLYKEITVNTADGTNERVTLEGIDGVFPVFIDRVKATEFMRQYNIPVNNIIKLTVPNKPKDDNN